MRSNVTLTAKIGHQYLQDLLGSTIAKCLSEPDVALEIDPFYAKSSHEVLEKNRTILIERVRALLNHIISKEMVDKIPPEIRFDLSLS